MLKERIDTHKNIVFFGGAGVSTESGIPDFRSADGLYQEQYEYPPETIVSHSFFVQQPELFFRFYKQKMLYPNAKPNVTHRALAYLEKIGKVKAVVTQNIDGLHQMAGSRCVFELHGSVHRNHCMQCGRFYGLDVIIKADGVPRCSCGGIIKPDVVLYEEALDTQTVNSAIAAIKRADMLIVGGTSLAVYPAAGLIDYFCGDTLVLINKTATPLDSKADVVLCESLGSVFQTIIDQEA